MRYFFILIIFCLFACQSKIEKIELVDEYGQQTIFEQDKETKKKNGTFVIRSKGGKLLEESNYRQDTLEGERKLYDENGVLMSIEQYQRGVINGKYQDLYDNGQVSFEAFYNEGILEGEVKSYYKDGQLKEVVQFKDNQENGPFVEYHPNGKLKTKGKYAGGRNTEDGLLEMYDETAILIKKMQCEAGRCVTIWTKEAGTVAPQ